MSEPIYYGWLARDIGVKATTTYLAALRQSPEWRQEIADILRNGGSLEVSVQLYPTFDVTLLYLPDPDNPNSAKMLARIPPSELVNSAGRVAWLLKLPRSRGKNRPRPPKRAQPTTRPYLRLVDPEPAPRGDADEEG